MLLLLLLPLPPPLPLLPSLPLLLFLRKAGLRWLAALPLPLPLLPGSGGRPNRLPRRSGAEVHHSMRNLHSKLKWISWHRPQKLCIPTYTHWYPGPKKVGKVKRMHT
jgi:hypothetical protein